MSLEENPPTGNAADASARIVALPSPSRRIRLWWCSLDVTPRELATCERLLSQAEHARAGRFGHARLRDRYVLGRGSLRAILGRELDADPAAVEIVRGRRGRPQLPPCYPLDFNISHTDAIAIVGVVDGARIGVDVERLDRLINTSGIARKFLTPGERDSLAGLTPDAARRRVLELWTCKEAMSKATGDALSAPFACIDIGLPDGRTRHATPSPAQSGPPTLRKGPAPYAPRDWSLFSADTPPAYVATVAVWRTR